MCLRTATTRLLFAGPEIRRNFFEPAAGSAPLLLAHTPGKKAAPGGTSSAQRSSSNDAQSRFWPWPGSSALESACIRSRRLLSQLHMT